MQKLKKVTRTATITLLIMLVSLPIAAFQVPDVSAWDNVYVHPHLCRESLRLLPEESAMRLEIANHMEDIVWGAKHEDINDVIYGITWNPTITHFWDADAGKYEPYTFAFTDYNNAYEKSCALFQRALDRYDDGDMLHAYHLLGRVAHLMQDMSVPAHAHEDEHPGFWAGEWAPGTVGGGDDCLENWFTEYDVYSQWTADPLLSSGVGLINFPDEVKQLTRTGWWWEGLYYLMYTTNQVADYFASDNEDGDTDDPEGWMDYSDFPDRPTRDWELDDNDRKWIPPMFALDDDNDHDGDLSKIVSCTIPYAIRAVATLYKIFYELTHPPTATITILPPADLDEDGAADHKWVRLHVTYDVGAPDYYRDLEARFRNEVGDWTYWEEVGAQPGGRIVSWMLSEGDGNKRVSYEVRNLMGLTNAEEASASITLRAWRVPQLFDYTITATGAASVEVDLDAYVSKVVISTDPNGDDFMHYQSHWWLIDEDNNWFTEVWYPKTGADVYSVPCTTVGGDFLDIPVAAGAKIQLTGRVYNVVPPIRFYGSIFTDFVEVPHYITPPGTTTVTIAEASWYNEDREGNVNPYYSFEAWFQATYNVVAALPQTDSGLAHVEYGAPFEPVASTMKEAPVAWTTQYQATVHNPAIEYYMDGPTLYAKTTKTEPEIAFIALSPVDVEITDPMGNRIGRHKEELEQDGIIVRYYVETNEIPGASILTTDLDGDGDTDTRFVFDEIAFGDYQIQVSPSVGEDPAETYSIALSSSALTQGDLFLSRDVPLAEIPPGGQVWTIENSPTGLNLPPEAKANGPYRATEGTPVEFDASGSSDPDGDSLTFRWDFENDGTWDTTWSSSPTASHTWNDDWTGTAKVEVSDGTLTDTSAATVTLTNARPTANAGPSQLAAPGAEVQFSGSFFDPGGLDTHAVKWDFGDETTNTDTLTPTHMYSEAGKYIVTLWVYDDDGGVGKDMLIVNTGVDVLIDPLSAFVPPGDSTTYNVLVHHLGTTDETYDFALFGLDSAWYSLSTASVALGAGQSESVTLTVSPPFAAAVDSYSFAVVAASQADPAIWDTADADAFVATAHDWGLEEIPPVTALFIGQPEYVDPISGAIFVTSSTPFTLTAEDNPDGTGVASTFYHILNATHDTGKLEYTAPFSLAGISDGQYSIVYYSKDNVANKEDAKSEIVILDTTPPTITSVANPVSINTPITLLATVDDSNTGGCTIASAQYSVDDGDWISMNAVDGNFDEVTEEVTATLSPIPTPDVFTIGLRGTDALGNGYQLSTLLAIYDPTAGFVTGAGWINSPLGAYSADPTLTGKATFGFVSRYQKGANTPTGHTEFQFHTGDLHFQSLSYKWLVVAGPRAQFKGSGTINKAGNYSFMLTAIDGQINGGGGVDKFRIKIWDKATEIIIYDNQIGDIDTDNPTTTIAAGNIVIHTK